MPLTAASQRLQPVAHHLSPERLQCGDVAGDGEVPEVRTRPAKTVVDARGSVEGFFRETSTWLGRSGI